MIICFFGTDCDVEHLPSLLIRFSITLFVQELKKSLFGVISDGGVSDLLSAFSCAIISGTVSSGGKCHVPTDEKGDCCCG